MPRCLVLQPDGKYAIWSTIVDDFTVFDCNLEEAAREMKRDIADDIKNISESGVSWDWAKDWNECVWWLERFNRQGESIQYIDKYKLPRRMKLPVSNLKRERYWKYYWYGKCQKLELELDQIKRGVKRV